MFAHVCVICWPILWWQLNALLAWSRRQSVVDLLYSVNDWSFITLRRAGEATHPETRKPLARTFRPLTDAACIREQSGCEGVRAESGYGSDLCERVFLTR